MATETTPINWFQKIGDLGTEGLSEGFKTGNFGLTDAERAFQLKQVMDQGQRFNAENSARLQAQREAQAPPMNIQRPTFPIMGNASMYQIPNRNFTWQTTPMEQARLAGNMGRPDLSGLLSTGEYGPLAGQQYQYQGGNTMINYGPGGGYGGGFGGGYGFNPWGNYGSNPWGDWTPPDWTPPDWTPPDWTPPDDPTYSHTHIDGTPPTVKPFDPVGVSEFHEQLRDDNERIRERNRLLDIYRDPTSKLNLDFGFEDRKSWAARGGNPVVNRANVLQDQALAQANHAKQQAALAQQEAARIAAMRARARANAMGGGRPVAPKSLAEELADANRSTSRLFGMDQAAQAQQQAQARVLQAQAQAHRAHQIAQQDRLRQALGFGVPSSALGGMPSRTQRLPDPIDAADDSGSRGSPISYTKPTTSKAPAFTSTGPSASDIRRQQEADAKREEANRAKAASVGQRQTASKGKAQAKVAAQKPTSSLSAGIKAAQKAMEEARKRKQAEDIRKAVKGATLRRTPQGKWAGGL
jgi:hypothetical protein